MGLDFKVLFRCVLTVDIVLCVAIIAANLLLLLAVVTSRRARARSRNAMLVSVCLADLMVGVFTHPLYIHSYRTATLFHSCQLHIALQLIGDYAQDFVCYWTLVTLGAQYAARLTAHRWGWAREAPGSYRPLNDPLPTRWRSAARASTKVLVVIWPWLVTLLVPIPILMSTVEDSTKEMLWDETFCPLHVSFPYRMAVLVLVYYLPVAALLLLCLLLGLVMYCDMAQAHSRRAALLRDAKRSLHPRSHHDLALSLGLGEPAAGTQLPTERDGAGGGGGSGGGRLQDSFPASGANRPFKGAEGRGDRAVNGHRGPQIYTSPSVRSSGSSLPPPPPPPPLPRRNDPAETDPRRVWSVADNGDDDNDNDDPQVMVIPTAHSREAGSTEANGRAESGQSRIIATRDARPTVTVGHAAASSQPDSVAAAAAGGSGEEPLEKPWQMLAPLMVVVVCALPLMVGWWFFDRLEHGLVIVLSVSLSRLYLLRAALLPAAWLALPDLRAAVRALLHRCCCCGRRGEGGVGGSGARGHLGHFAVAYRTLQDTVDALPPSGPQDGWREGVGQGGGRAEIRRQNPFDRP